MDTKWAICFEPDAGWCPSLFFPFLYLSHQFLRWAVHSYTKKNDLDFHKLSRAVIGLPWWLSGKEFACQAEDAGSIPGSGRSLGGRHDNPLQYSCLGNPMDRGAWQVIVHRVTKSQTWLSTPTSFLRCQAVTPGSTCFPQNSMDRESAPYWPLPIWNNVDCWTRCLGRGEVLGWLSGSSIWVTSYQPWKEVFYYARWEETRSRSFFSILTPGSERN